MRFGLKRAVMLLSAIALCVGLAAAAPGGNGATVEKYLDWSTEYSNECVAPGVFSPISGTLHLVRHTRTAKDGTVYEKLHLSLSNVTGIDVLTGEEFRVVGQLRHQGWTFFGDPGPSEREYTIRLNRIEPGPTSNERYVAFVTAYYDANGDLFDFTVEFTVDCRG